MLTNEYLKRVYEGLEKRNANEPEFLQAVREVLESMNVNLVRQAVGMPDNLSFNRYIVECK